MFVSLGLSAVFPVLHGLQLYGASQMEKQIGLRWLVLEGGLYILGAEKWFPGRHDICGSSHQIFHVLIVLAVASHFIGLLQAFDYRHGVWVGCASS